MISPVDLMTGLQCLAKYEHRETTCDKRSYGFAKCACGVANGDAPLAIGVYPPRCNALSNFEGEFSDFHVPS